MKRFWKDVAVVSADTGWEIRLDSRPVRTPGRRALALASKALVMAIAEEWRSVDGDIDPGTMPLTGLANATIDRIAPDPVGFAAGLARYGETDLLCYRADAPPELRARQDAAWDPVLDWAAAHYDVEFVCVTGIMHQPQPRRTLDALAQGIAARTPTELAALFQVVTIGGSLVLALALAERAIDGERLWRAAHIDEDWQIDRWGDDDLARIARDARRADYDAAVRFLLLADDRV